VAGSAAGPSSFFSFSLPRACPVPTHAVDTCDMRVRCVSCTVVVSNRVGHFAVAVTGMVRRGSIQPAQSHVISMTSKSYQLLQDRLLGRHIPPRHAPLRDSTNTL